MCPPSRVRPAELWVSLLLMLESTSDPALTDALHQLRARLDSLEADNERSDEHVRALQHRLRHDRHADAERSASFEQNQHDKQSECPKLSKTEDHTDPCA